MSNDYRKGYTGRSIDIAGFEARIDGNAPDRSEIICYGETWDEAEALRDKILASLSTTPAAPEAGAPLDAETVGRMVEGLRVSVDVSSGDDDIGRRLFGKVYGVQGNPGDLTILVCDAEPNFAVPTAPAVDLPDDAAPASTILEAMDLLDFGLMFALCNRDHAGTRRDVKKVQAQLRRLRELLAEQKSVGEVIHFKGGGGVLKFVRMDFDAFPEGTKLYVEPVAQPDASVLVEALAEIAAMEPEPGEPESFMDDADFRYLKCLRKMQKIARATIEAAGVRGK